MSEESSTEEKILNAARKIFKSKGFAATKTREIAEEAGINLALLNYYFRSKQKLFDIILHESINSFFVVVIQILNEKTTSVDEKLEALATTYFDMLIENRDLPLFLLNEMKNDPEKFGSEFHIIGDLKQSSLFQQLEEMRSKGEIMDVDPLQIMINSMSMLIFPFLANSMIMRIGSLSETQFVALVEERKKLVPVWIKQSIGLK